MTKVDKADLMFRFLNTALTKIGTTVEDSHSSLQTVYDPDDGFDTYGKTWKTTRPITGEEVLIAGNQAIQDAYAKQSAWAVEEWYRYVTEGKKHSFKMSPPEGWEEADFMSVESLRAWAEYHADSFHTTWEERDLGLKRYQAMLKKVFA